ncbi:MAG: hypothetical protein KC503_42885 [Myxococcales bacterium]|nr:hypothetical protein [Myxococcales bacterium]
MAAAKGNAVERLERLLREERLALLARDAAALERITLEKHALTDQLARTRAAELDAPTLERVRGIAMHNARLSSSLRARLALLVGGGRPQCYDRNAMTRSAPLALLSRRG